MANPDWEYRLYDDAERRAFIEAHYDNRTLRLYDRISPRYGAARADFFRYSLMYSVGGVYLDVKSTVVQPLSSVISDDTPYLMHRKIIPNYREIRFPVVNLGPDATPQQRAYHWLAIFVAYLHEASKVGGIRSRLTEFKKQRIEMKRASARR